MNFKKFSLYVGVVIIVLTSCKKTSITHSTPTNTISMDVYVAGYINGLQGQSMAAYWKNGIAVKLTDSMTTQASASGIAVQGRDVYVAGTRNATGHSVLHIGKTVS